MDAHVLFSYMRRHNVSSRTMLDNDPCSFKLVRIWKAISFVCSEKIWRKHGWNVWEYNHFRKNYREKQLERIWQRTEVMLQSNCRRCREAERQVSLRYRVEKDWWNEMWDRHTHRLHKRPPLRRFISIYGINSVTWSTGASERCKSNSQGTLHLDWLRDTT